MKDSPTLIDAAIRESLRNSRDATIPASVRGALVGARRFVLDESMSAFLADLTCGPFFDPETGSIDALTDRERTRRVGVIENARRLARLPHPTTWIEYDARARRRRSREAYPAVQSVTSGALVGEDEIVPYVGWLLEAHPNFPAAVRMTEFMSTRLDGHGGPAMMPFSSAWVSDDGAVLPWRPIPRWPFGRAPSEVATGMLGWKSDLASIVENPRSPIAATLPDESLEFLLTEYAGELRCALTFLATIADLPVLRTDVRTSKGFVVRGSYRRFLDHTVISLRVPTNRTARTLATRVLANLRRRAHQVRSHWRKDWRNPLSPICEHDFVATEDHVTCRLCGGRKTLIHEHQRGDSSLGFVTHDYRVTHPAR